MSFIDRNKDKPFLCYVPFTTPHSPWAAPEEDWNRFRDMPTTQPATDPKAEVANHTRCALAMVRKPGHECRAGPVTAKLRELKVDDNTIVVYFSDNGPNSFRWTGGMKGRKGSTDEGGVRSVYYIRWPAKLPRRSHDDADCGSHRSHADDHVAGWCEASWRQAAGRTRSRAC